ncbi:DUF4743 domain-containing protein [Telmatospirillum sp.]|uniref:NUDIX hydrolase n=1 Tax=Telmatospirillum sp. TaxID=2079197 RepID=UPI00283B8FE2|nr:DUF4743 domain-containing protein [Telmatospirillum sp.]MDR3437591.1 DUF4743 domain-containing protein [Telmatospirillum sp.]
MSLLDHVKRCNAFVPADYRPLEISGCRIGAVRQRLAERLAAFPDIFVVSTDRVVVSPRLTDAATRTAALREVVDRLSAEGTLAKTLGEDYRVVSRWGEEPFFLIDRSAVSAFGIAAFGVHLNGFVRHGRTVKLWIAKRAPDKAVEPGKLDNMVAGGQPAGLGLSENLAKEAAEEAGMPRDLALTATPVGAISYCMAGTWGLKPDTMFVYDLELPTSFTPTNTDGEVSQFFLMEPEEILDLLRHGQRFKFNVPLVLIDFFIRHGILSAENEPEYLDLVRGLRTLP